MARPVDPEKAARRQMIREHTDRTHETRPALIAAALTTAGHPIDAKTVSNDLAYLKAHPEEAEKPADPGEETPLAELVEALVSWARTALAPEVAEVRARLLEELGAALERAGSPIPAEEFIQQVSDAADPAPDPREGTSINELEDIRQADDAIADARQAPEVTAEVFRAPERAQILPKITESASSGSGDLAPGPVDELREFLDSEAEAVDASVALFGKPVTVRDTRDYSPSGQQAAGEESQSHPDWD